ncbi:hypothetical protein IGI04_014072 [Brassica rapa subsp. trilocularis]|uniref:Uncharacterized protein n=1 Tax=Brassica rapa subsp. trilocularis TaxID=1813537 RepID=A0ABQ7ML60_BRACM|nr:hypothetical protein IGI04_014072 [Brassica rapa subsp. trilocularis]
MHEKGSYDVQSVKRTSLSKKKLGFSLPDPITEAKSHAVFLDAGKAFGCRRRVLFSVACFALLWFYFFVLVNCWNRVSAVSYGSAPSCPLVSTSLTPRLTTASPTPLWVASSSHGSLRLTASPVSRRLTVSSAVHLHVTTHPLRTRRSAKALNTRSARLSETAEPTLECQSEPPLLTSVNVHHIPPLDALLSVQAEPPDLRIPRVDSSDLGVYAYLKRLIPSVPELNPDRFLELSFRNVAIGVWFSSGLDEIYGSRYGNIGVHFLSWSLVRTPSWLIFRNIASPLPRRLRIPIPSESRWYSNDTCFGLNQNYLWSLNLLIVINLSHYSFSEASCLFTVCHCASVQRVHLAQNRDVVLKLPLFVHPSQVSRVFISSHFVTGAIRFHGPSYMFVSVKSRTFILSGSVEIHLVSSWNLDVGARVVHALSTSFQTLQFGIINVGFDYFMLVVVTYSGIHLMLPTVLQWMSKTLSFSFVITCFMLCFMIIKPSRIPPVLILLPLSLAPDVMV